MRLRQFNRQGISEFRSFLANCRIDPTTALPQSLLDDEATSTLVEPAIQIEPQLFVKKDDAARYLREALAPLPDIDVAANDGLWTWLTLYYFDQVCPSQNGRRSVKNDYHYVFEPKNHRHYYRHLLFISWQVLRVADSFGRIMLVSKLSTLDAVTTVIMGGLYVTRIPCIFEVIDRIYWDDVRQRPRVGIVDTRTVQRGDLRHRLRMRVKQVEMTYDLQSMTADQLIELLGDEFTHWQSPRQVRRRPVPAST